ncbi:autotransporter outer membrane beta-barrel domain-containing protein [Asaia prunellae]|uniref:hypothetical protein n=1 Tax=Asaia prunellae TaxID=610245 RepID=UPI0011DE1818|nr:hypothetical protein [Asaia prunellae]
MSKKADTENGILTAPQINDAAATNLSVTNLTSGGLLQPPFVSILAKGAKCDGTTDDTVAINAVLSAYNNVAIPQGISKCLVSSPINITRNGTTLVGAGQTSVTFVSNSATAPVISVAAGLSNYTLSGFSVDRSVVPASDTARGIDTSGGGGGFATLRDIYATNQWTGFYLGGMAYGVASNLTAQNNYGDGFYLSNNATYTTAQWNLTNTISQTNDGYGYNVVSNTKNPMILLPWWDTQAFANGLGGARFVGTPEGYISNINIEGGIFSTDGNNELFFDTYSGHITVSGGTFIEAAGTAATGRDFKIPKSNTGRGIYTTGNIADIQIGDVIVFDNSQEGYVGSAFRTQIVGAEFLQNGANGAAGTCSINLLNTNTNATVMITGTRSGALNSNLSTSAGICAVNGTGVTITGNDLAYNSQVGVYFSGNAAGAHVEGNAGYITVARGEVTIPANAVSATVTHGLPGVPYWVSVSPTAAPGSAAGWYADTKTQSSFTVHIQNAQSYPVTFSWEARMFPN